MANVLNAVIRNGLMCPIRCATKSHQAVNAFQNQVRTLYAKSTLGLDNYESQRTRTQHQLANISEKFKTKMGDYTTDDSKNMIFTEDLKNMVHLAEKSDIELVIKMMNRFNEQNKQLRFGNFIFGPVVMRMFYFLNTPDEALKCFISPELSGFFDQLISYQLLMDLLYENGKYEEMLQAFEAITNRQIEGTKYPKNIIVLTMAACYKLNTKESYQYALKLWGNLAEVGHLPMRRAVTFLAGLALRQGQPEVALEIASSARNQNYTTIRNLKVAALAGLGRVEDIIPILKGILQQDDAVTNNFLHTFNHDVLDQIQVAVDKLGNDEIKQEYKRISEYFQEHKHISKVTLDEQLCGEIATPPFVSNKDFRNRNQSQFSFGQYQQRGGQRTRPNFDRRDGLSDLQ